jgi:succinate dehydrogenase / fumarate reductase, iron-sulfur subunit
MDVELRVRRFNPEQDEAPHWETYHIDAEPTDRVLDLLHQVKWYQDGTLTFRRSCAHGVCGSDAMVINGRNRLACESLVQDLGSTITVEALKAVPLVKDLLVDMDGFMDKYKQVMPFLVNDEPLPEDGKERRQSQAERERYDDTTKCILCAACTTACPVFWTNPAYVGPAAIVNAHRFIFDSRDQAHEERLEIMADADGVWRCRTIFNCVEACPRGINVTGAIMEVIGEIQKAGASS